MALQGRIYSSTNTTETHDRGENVGDDPLYENELVYTALFRPAMPCFDLCLLENPIHTIGPDGMKPFYPGNGQDRRVGLRILQG
ncbi:MAG: hypothetical protein LBI87_05295 [Candidatus Accumulibacter sp.]|nr:hypothetical protein [Accumulibacter sp.]